MVKLTRSPLAPFVLALIPLLIIYASTLQTIPNGSSDYFMIDVGETQIVLNSWGSLHATGYPLYVMTGNILTSLMRLFGIDALIAAALVSLLWGVIMLALFYVLAVHFTAQKWAAAGVTLLFGLTRTVWIHHVIAEIYTFGLVIVLVLLLVALWREPIAGRIYWLALIGGIGVAHHRATIVLAPALLFAVWAQLTAQPRKLPRIVTLCLLLGLSGLTQYLYMYLRGQSGAAWVYGDPGTLNGLWDQFIGAEANRFIGLPDSLDALLANFALVNGVLITDLTLPGIIIGVIGLVAGLRTPRLRKASAVLLLAGGGSYLFHVLLYSDVLSALILQITVCLAFGWVFALVVIAASLAPYFARSRLALALRLLFLGSLISLAFVLFSSNFSFITALTRDATGLDTIAIAREAPANSTLMLDWGPRHFAVGVAQTLWGELPTVTLVDHKADFAVLIRERPLITPEWTFYNRPLAWWEAQLGQPVYLHAAAPYLVEIATTPTISDNALEAVGMVSDVLRCENDALILEVLWYTPSVPSENLSVFVHALDSNGALIGQGDQAHPVYGWRPLSTWQAGETVRDIYPLAVDPAAVQTVRYGLYRTTAEGFENVVEYEHAANCEG